MALTAKKIEKLAEKGRLALRDHAAACAEDARRRYGRVDYPAITTMLEDRKVVRYPTELRFSVAALVSGEFAYAEPLGERPSEGYRLWVHPYFEQRLDDLPRLIAYHIPAVNYGDVVTEEDAEVFAATLLGEDRDEYYERLCALADELPMTTGEEDQS